MARFEIKGRERRGRNGATYALLAGHEVPALLDYGCGDARLALAIAEEFEIEVHACDVDAAKIERLAREHGDEVDFFAVPDGRPQLPLADDSVSAITCCDVFEHMPASLRREVLAEMRRVLRPDGILVLTTPHKGLFGFLDPENFKYHFPRLHETVYSLARGRDKYRRTYGDAAHFGNYSGGHTRHVHFNRAELAALVAEAGFEVDEVRYFSLFQPLIRGVLWTAEGLAGRLPGAERLRSACWKLYWWDSGLEPGRLGYAIGIRARPVTG